MRFAIYLWSRTSQRRMKWCRVFSGLKRKLLNCSTRRVHCWSESVIAHPEARGTGGETCHQSLWCHNLKVMATMRIPAALPMWRQSLSFCGTLALSTHTHTHALLSVQWISAAHTIKKLLAWKHLKIEASICDTIFYIPQVLLSYSSSLAICTYGITCLVAAVAAMLLPIETKGREMKVMGAKFIFY